MPISFSASETYEQALNRAAELWGIECEYWDIWGNKHHASSDGIAAVLASLGIASDTIEAIDFAIERRLCLEWSRIVPPTTVVDARVPEIRVRIPREDAPSAVELVVRWENGKNEHHTFSLGEVPDSAEAVLGDRHFVEKALTLPREAPLGYHDVTVSIGARSAATRFIACPERAFFPKALARNGRAAGIAVSLYAVRSGRNWGCGDFTDLKALVDWVGKDVGASFLGLNPLHAIPNREPYNTSPYLPTCTFYKNPIYLDLEAIDDFKASSCARRLLASDAVQSEIAALRGAEFVEYERVYSLKRRFLKLSFRTFLREYRAETGRALQFRLYVAEQGELLHDFAVYSALDEAIHLADPNVWLWTDWPDEYRDPRSPATIEFAKTHWRSVLFHKYIQWQIEQQLEAAQQHSQDIGMAIGLYHDLALATDQFGADLWAHRRFYVGGCRVGAPPDDFSPSGQDWSFPPPNSDAHFEDGYRLFAESIRKNLCHGGALRIDHVMRFFHLFWIPGKLEAKRGLYVRDRHEDLIRILALESVRNRVLVVGEDLGTVAGEIRGTLQSFGILSYRLFYFEKTSDGRMKLPHEYPQQALVSASTHDLPTLPGFWESRDIEARRRAGMFLSDEDYYRQLRERTTDKQRMLDIVFILGLMPKHLSRSAADYPEMTGELHNAIVGFLATTPSALMVLNEEDLMKQGDQQNLPGTCEQYLNWKHKTRFTIEELQQSPARDFGQMYRGWLNVTGRLNSR